MGAPAFTPGPWEARDGSLHRQHWLIDAPARRFIATIDGPPDEEGEANARLIAAAPELYEAADAMVRWDEAEKAARPFDEDAGRAFYARMDLCAEAFDKARAALAKARGEQ